MANGTMKTIFVFNNKVVARVLLASLTDSLPLAQLKYSLNTFCSPPESSHLLKGLAT